MIPVLRSLKKTPIDNLVGHLCLTFELVWPKSYELVRDQGWLDRMIDLGMQTRNGLTKEKMAEAANEVRNYMNSRI